MRIPKLPAGSKISIQETSRGTELCWKNQGSNMLLIIASSYSLLFRLFWLVGWTIGGCITIHILVTRFDETPLFAKLFISFWLIGWAIGEYSVIRSLLDDFRKKKPERIILDSISLTHDPGEFLDGSEILEDTEDPESVPAEYKLRRISKEDIGSIQLEKMDDAQVLAIDFAGEKVLVGIFLPEHDQQWLYDVLMDWKEA